MNNEVMIVAGEASGDLHGSRLLTAMLDRDPSLHFSPGFGISGQAGEAGWPIARSGHSSSYGSRGIGQDAKPDWVENRIGQPVHAASAHENSNRLYGQKTSAFEVRLVRNAG